MVTEQDNQIENIEEDDIFNEVLRKREEQAKRKDTPTYTYVPNNNREQIPWFGLEDKVESVIRILGNPVESRKENWHGKAIFFSELATDTRKRYSDILWHTKKDYEGNSTDELDEQWILRRLVNTVYAKSWENKSFVDAKGVLKKGKYIHHHEDTEIYKLLEGNDLDIKTEVKVFPKKFRPQKRVILPVLVRNTGGDSIKVLSTKYSVKEYTTKKGEEGQSIYVDFGIPISESPERKYLYDLLLDKIFFKYRHWDFDIIIKKQKLTDIQIAYDIFPCFSSEISTYTKSLVSELPKMENVNVTINGKVVQEPRPLKVKLTPQEESLEKPNLDILFKETSFEKLFQFHKKLFQLADSTFNTTYYEELVDSFTKENPEGAKNIPATQVTLPVTQSISNQEAPVRRASIVESTITQSGVDLISQCKQTFTAWENLSDADKDLMVKTIDSFEDGVPVYKSEYLKQIYLCNCKEPKFFNKADGTQSNKNISCHQDVTTCPMCADKLM